MLDCTTLFFKVDGKKLSHGMTCKSGQSVSKKGVRTGLDIEQPLQFADLQTTGASLPRYFSRTRAPVHDGLVDDDELLNGLSNQADVGSIEVAITRVYAEGRPASVTIDSFSGMGAVHERSKKAGAHSVGCVLLSLLSSCRLLTPETCVSSSCWLVYQAGCGIASAAIHANVVSRPNRPLRGQGRGVRLPL